MGKTTIEFNLSEESIRKAIQELEQYKKDLNRKIEIFTEKLAQKGVEIAKMNIGVYDAIYTGELLRSINYEKGAVIEHGSKYIVYTDCLYAKFVEFGFGAVGAQHPHPDTSIVGWKYDVNEHGEEGWFYFKDGEWHWTKGFPSRPFFFETAMQLRNEVVKIAKEVFG